MSKWLSKNMDAKCLARFHVRLNRIEKDETIPTDWLKPYTSLSMQEIRFDYGGSAFRFLCEQTGSNLVVLLATTKDCQITDQEEARAVRLRKSIIQGAASVRDYPLPGRLSDNLASFR